VRKFRNIKTVVDGVTFDSKREAARWSELLLLQRARQISDLRRQVPIVLAPSVKFDGEKRAKPALRLVVDFAYIEAGREVLEDVKSPATITTAFTIKRHILKAFNGLELRLTA
jgi:hypothetical protein